jgi:fatty-acid desaturase
LLWVVCFVLLFFSLSHSHKKLHKRIQRENERSDPPLHNNHRSLFLSLTHWTLFYLYPSDDAAATDDSITKKNIPSQIYPTMLNSN